MRSQDRQHEGKRGAALRKARRDGYADAHVVHHNARHYLDVAITPKDTVAEMAALNMFKATRSPHLISAYRHGAHDWARKHGGNRDGSYDKAAE